MPAGAGPDRTMDPGRPVRILSLDGGGIRGLSSLLILEHIMESIMVAEGLKAAPNPRDWFDLIGGVSTGGIIAIMLGRLGMSVAECIRAYKKVAQRAFTPKYHHLPKSPNGKFSATELEAAIRETIQEHCKECAPETSQKPLKDPCTHSEMEFRDKWCTPTVVLAITGANVDARPTRFTTYDTSAALQGCKIWEVARATSAATTFFKPIKIGRDEIEFVDAAFGYNNPCDELIQEARQNFPGRERLLVLSIGTGDSKLAPLNGRAEILKALKTMATSAKRVADDLDRRFGNDGQYFRFNVENGLEDVTLSDWEKSSEISAHTRNYISENQTRLAVFVQKFLEQPERAPVVVGSSAERDVEPDHSLYHIPLFKNECFVGRTEILESLREKLFGGDGTAASSSSSSRVVALFGLGGIGKTQVALQLAYWAKENMPGWSVVWVPVLSEAGFEQACVDILNKLGVASEKGESAKDTFRRHFSSAASGRWLLIVDNADDRDVVSEIDNYLPQSIGGRTLFTTRSRHVAVDVASKNILELSKLSLVEGRKFLEKALVEELSPGDGDVVDELLAELAFLPLAITQAAAYMNANQESPAKYLQIFRSTDKDKVELLASRFADRTRYRETQTAVATTWVISFRKITENNPDAGTLLSFVSGIEPKAIPRSMLPDFGSEQRVTAAIGLLRGYSFWTSRDNGEIFDMHSLVHLAMREWIQEEEEGGMKRVGGVVLARLHEVFPGSQWENRDRWRLYMPHALRVLGQDGPAGWNPSSTAKGAVLGQRVASCLLEDERIREAVGLLETVEAATRALPDDHSTRLKTLHKLGMAYAFHGQTTKSIQLIEQVLAICNNKGENSDEHNLGAESQRWLATAYRKHGNTKKAVELLEGLVKVYEKEKDDDGRRLGVHQDLGLAYLANRQIKEGVKQLEEVTAVVQRLFPKEHSERLATETNLAAAYSRDGNAEKAVEVLEEVEKIREGLWELEHPKRLFSQCLLAEAYLGVGEAAKTIQLLELLVPIKERTLGEENESLLGSQYLLAKAYLAKGEPQKAIPLLKRIEAIEKRTVGEDHPNLWMTRGRLAQAYLHKGEMAKGIDLLEQAVAKAGRVFGTAGDSTEVLVVRGWLAEAYEDRKRATALEASSPDSLLRHQKAESSSSSGSGPGSKPPPATAAPEVGLHGLLSSPRRAPSLRLPKAVVEVEEVTPPLVTEHSGNYTTSPDDSSGGNGTVRRLATSIRERWGRWRNREETEEDMGGIMG